MSTEHLDDDALVALLQAPARAAGEGGARAHLAACAPCRARYDEQVRLLRALAGAPSEATRAEDDAVVQRVLARTHPAPHVAARPAARRRALPQLVPLAAAAACVALFVVLARPAPAPVLAGTITHAKDAALDGAPVAEGALWHAGQALVVPAGGLAEVRLARGGTLRVFPSSQLVLGARGEDVALARGKVWALIERGDEGTAHGGASPAPFEVRTPHGSARVLGTSFLVEARDEITDVKVVEGRVEVRPAPPAPAHTRARAAPGGGPVVVKAGERVRVTTSPAAGPAAGGRVARVEAPTRYDARADLTEWQRFFDELLRAIGKGIQQGIDDVLKALEPKKRR